MVTHPAGNLTFRVRWDPERGLPLRMAIPKADRAVVIELDRKAPRLRSEPPEAAAPLWIEGAQFNVDALPTQRLAAVEVVVKFRQETWSVYIADRPVAVLPVPFLPPATVAHPDDLLPPADRREVRFQKTDDFVFHDDFLVPEGEENELAAWEVQSGVWSLHSVADEYKPKARLARAAANGKARAKGDRKPTASMSPNFYSLIGGGSNAVLTAGYEFYDAYSVEAAVQVGPGEGGVVFDFGPWGYHAFTVRPEGDTDKVRLSLWRTASSNAAVRTELAAVTAGILDGQWVKLQVRTFQNRIQCFVDRTQVIDTAAELPVGGCFGVFANTDSSLLFDDVTARSNHDLDFMGVADIRRHTLVEQGHFFPRRRFFSLFPPRETPFLEPPESSDAQWMIVGSTAHAPHVFAAQFRPESAAGEYGVIAGYLGEGRPYQRFVMRRDATQETFRLETVATNGVRVLRRLALPVTNSPAVTAAAVTLTCDATADGDLRCYRNRDLVLVEHANPPPGGASGLYVGPDTRVRIAAPEYVFERADLYTDQFEKNTAFLVDRFMRHWSSPEGQWEDPTNHAAWYKGDVFGRVAVHLPLVDHTALHLGVAEGTSTGACVVTVADGWLELRAGATLADSHAAPLDAMPTNLVRGTVGGVSNRVTGYTVHAEGYWLWVTSGDALLLQHALPAPLTGRRLRIEGFTTEQLSSSRVERYNVKDFLFKESLHEWTLNGGNWEVINRFQCDPRWSHMDGESTNGLAAMWSKYVFRGDFCVEMYAGTRHGWYERCGDYNLTVLNTDTTPSQGYTVTCTGWDPDLSQLYTTLYRDGMPLTRSDDYCAPRIREGNKRKLKSALVESGRDVHGAWYYIKFRRVGTRLEYYFDNERVFACDDPRPLTAGSLGVWTYMTSMVVARVKIAAESVEPRPLAFQPAPPAAPPAEETPPAGAPVDDWEAADPVSRGRLAWHASSNAPPYFTLTSVLGSGTMLAQYDAATVPYPSTAGWRFDVKRTARARFNFHFSLGRRNTAGVYVPEQYFVHRLSGEDFPRGPYRPAGATEAPAAGVAGQAAWHEGGGWTPVTVWLPTEGLRYAVGDTGLLVRVEGFGALQPGYAMQGLTGNGPGEAYAVRGFARIPYAAPAARTPLSCRWSTRAPDTLDLRADTTELCRALAFAEVTVCRQPATTRFVPPAGLEVVVPRADACATDPVIAVSGAPAITNAFALRWSDAAVRSPPVLVRIEGATPFFENFERDGTPLESPSRQRIEGPGSVSNRYLAVCNTALGQRLTSEFGPAFSLARNPLLRFRYRGGPMARVSLVLVGAGVVRLSEPAGSARAVRGGGDLVLDDQWHTWQGFVSDGVTEQPYSPGAMTAARLRWTSVDSPDQTGRYTEWALDDITVGRAISRGDLLAFTPRYFDFEGVAQVEMAVYGGPQGFESLVSTQRTALVWRAIANNASAQPDISGLPDGAAHLLLRARSTRGLDSAVTDIPFLVHRKPPRITAGFEPATDPMGNGSQLVLSSETEGGPPLDVEALRFSWNDSVVAVTNTLCSRFVPGVDRQKVVLNWPMVFRHQLNGSGAGEAFRLGITQLRDGASNAVADIVLPRRIDYASDHTPPTLLPTMYPSNILWTTAWEVNSEARTFLTPVGSTTAALVRKPGEAPWLAIQPGSTTGSVSYTFSPRWRVKRYPYLAFRMRRPVLPADAKTRIDVVLDCDTNRTITIGLTPGPAMTNRLALPKPIEWVSNEWASVTLDVGKYMAQGGVTVRQPVVKTLSFNVAGATTNSPLHLQSVFVFAGWGPGDKVVLDGYDESGIGGVSWESVQHSDTTDVEPTSVAASGEGWTTLRMRDKAGNVSVPLYLPTGGRHAGANTDDP